MKLNNTFGFGKRFDGFINEVRLTCRKGLEYGIHLNSGVEAVILAVLLFLSTCTLTFASPLVVLIGVNVFLFHWLVLNKLVTFAEPCQDGGRVAANPLWNLASYLKAYLYFPNLKYDFEAHTLRILAGFFLLPFKRFRFLFCNPLMITTQRYHIILKKQN